MIIDTELPQTIVFAGYEVLFSSLFDFLGFESIIDVFPLLEIFIFILMLFLMRSGILAVISQLNAAFESLKKYSRNSGRRSTTVEQISNLFSDAEFNKQRALIGLSLPSRGAKKANTLAEIWHEFNESLVISYPDSDDQEDRKEYRNTLDANHFFKTEAVCEHLVFFEAVPGILTGAAILGTFAGIIFGIQSSGLAEAIQYASTPNGSEAFGAAIGKFLVSLGDAFAASFWGLFLALLFTCIERLYVARLENVLSQFNHRVNHIFPRQTSEQLLIDLAASNDRQVVSLEELVREIPKQIVKSLVEGGVNHVEIDAGIQKGIQAGFQGLLDRLRQINDFHDKYYSSVKGVVEQLSAVSKSIADFGEAQETITKNSDTAASRMDLAGENFQQAATATVKALATLEGQLITLSQVEKGIEERTSSIVEAGAGLGDSLRDAAEQFVLKSEELVSVAEKTSTGLKQGFGEIDGYMATAVTELGRSIGNLSSFLEALVDKVEVVESRAAEREKADKVLQLEGSGASNSSSDPILEQK